MPYVGLEDIASGGAGLFLGNLDPQTDKSTTFEFEPGHVLYGRLRPYLNKVLLPEFVGHCSSEIFPLLPLPQLDRGFLFHWLTSQRTVDAINATCTGARMPRANISELMTFPIPLPPLDEQKRIVAVLDEACEGLSRARANAEANLADARELFKRELEVEFAYLAEAYPRRTVGDIAVIKGGKRLPKGEKLIQSRTPFPYISIKDFNDAGSIDISSVDYLTPKTREAIKNYIIRAEDLYISIAGTIGKTGIIPAELDGANLTENAARMVFKAGIRNDYVFFFTLTDDFQIQAGLNTRTAAQPKLALERLKTISLPVADPETQATMVERFRSIREQSTLAQDNFLNKVEAIDTLRQSILQKAFSGELT